MNKPYVHAGELSPEELRTWLHQVSGAAQAAGGYYSLVLIELNNAERSLSFVSEDLERRINFLSSDQIVRSADHASTIQADLSSLRGIFAAVRDTRQTILSSIAQLPRIEYRDPAQVRKTRLPRYAEQALAKETEGQ